MTSEATAGQVPDVYGQVHPVETPQLIKGKLKDFDAAVEELRKQKDDSHKSLFQAMEKCPELLTRDFKLMFLRCEVFNTDLAVERYSQYWEKRVKVFGPEKAFQPLTLDKAVSDDHVALELGMMRVVHGVTDPTGRAIVYLDPSVQDRTKYARLSMCRALWYTLHAALELESAQKHGVVLLADPGRAKFSQFDRGLSKVMIPSLQGAIPLRLSALHMCNPPAFVSIILPIVKLFMSERMKKRLLLHSGGKHKVLNRLSTYGLEKSMIPAVLGGEVTLDHIGWVKERQSKKL